MDLTLTRRGSFRIRHVGNDATQCGLRGTRKLFFRVEVTCDESALDENGFIVDQLEILRLMRERHAVMQTMPSCERLALDCCREIEKLCKGVKKIRVSIGAGKFAFITAEHTPTFFSRFQYAEGAHVPA
jgi:hypothetical protein